ncbi:hypothetical protein OBBRIDRAFT_548693 [Obba rivulosa]|uniref:Uncharacterized protein n=1 Tax=Obba rivulosa TaxID=1052685 RepID=A0A8E2B2N4_9APHY|nr:hypothetical protein OBBRIDRAFT_548693 [Obba rivulosa]
MSLPLFVPQQSYVNSLASQKIEDLVRRYHIALEQFPECPLDLEERRAFSSVLEPLQKLAELVESYLRKHCSQLPEDVVNTSAAVIVCLRYQGNLLSKPSGDDQLRCIMPVSQVALMGRYLDVFLIQNDPINQWRYSQERRDCLQQAQNAESGSLFCSPPLQERLEGNADFHGTIPAGDHSKKRRRSEDEKSTGSSTACERSLPPGKKRRVRREGSVKERSEPARSTYSPPGIAFPYRGASSTNALESASSPGLAPSVENIPHHRTSWDRRRSEDSHSIGSSTAYEHSPPPPDEQRIEEDFATSKDTPIYLSPLLPISDLPISCAAHGVSSPSSVLANLSSDEDDAIIFDTSDARSSFMDDSSVVDSISTYRWSLDERASISEATYSELDHSIPFTPTSSGGCMSWWDGLKQRLYKRWNYLWPSRL